MIRWLTYTLALLGALAGTSACVLACLVLAALALATGPFVLFHQIKSELDELTSKL